MLPCAWTGFLSRRRKKRTHLSVTSLLFLFVFTPQLCCIVATQYGSDRQLSSRQSVVFSSVSLTPIPPQSELVKLNQFASIWHFTAAKNVTKQGTENVKTHPIANGQSVVRFCSVQVCIIVPDACVHVARENFLHTTTKYIALLCSASHPPTLPHT